MSYGINNEIPGGSRIRPGSVPVPEHPVMTVASRQTMPQAETVVAQSFKAFEQAIKAQNEVNEAANSEFSRGYLTEQGYQEQRAAIQSSPAARLVDEAEDAVKARAAQAQQRYDQLIGSRNEGDAAAEIRAERLLGQVRRKVEAAQSPGVKVAVAQQALVDASRDQRGLIADECAALFPGQDVSWVQKTMVATDPELAAAATTLKRANQAAQLASFAADQVRQGFQNGRPPVTVSQLAKASSKYDPDIEV